MTRRRTPSAPGAARFVWLIAAGGVAIIAALVASYAGATADGNPAQLFAALSLVGSLLAFVLCGALIVSRQPRNIVGWLLMIPGLALPAATLATGWLGSMPPPQEVTPLSWLLLWSLSWSWILLIFPIFHLLLTFPAGRLLSSRWRWAVALEASMVAIFLAFVAFKQDLGVLVNDETAWTVPNPVGFLPNDLFDASLGGLWQLGLVAITIVSVSAVVLRFRRGSTTERQQLKWPLLAVVVFGALYAGASIEPDLVDGSILLGVALAGIPISVAIAVLRYRLFAIDHIISRTVSWTAITAILLAVFIGGVLGIQTMLAGVTKDQTLAVAASTLVAFALFQPLRGRVQRIVDRRFDRTRYDGQTTTAVFADRVRNEVDLAILRDELVATAAHAVRPVGAGLWLRPRPGP